MILLLLFLCGLFMNVDRKEILDASVKLAEFLNNRSTIYLTWDNDGLEDFTKVFDGKIQIHLKEKCLSIPLFSQDLISHFITQVFPEGRLIITWDVKKFFSYLKFNLPKYFQIKTSAKVIDLKYAEAFAGKHNKKPSNWTEAVERLRTMAKNSSFPKIRQRLHEPLSMRVLPAIETTGILDSERREMRYSSYEIEGQVNGRLSCTKVGDFFNPHSMSNEEKKKFLPGLDKKFIWFDYRSMEVSVLHWLSQDAHLGELLLNSVQDLYCSIYEVITKKPCINNARREFAKDVFLPVIFGLQAKSLSERHNLSIKVAQLIIDRIYSNFSTALGWLEEQVTKAKNNEFSDYFGRSRSFDKAWTARNASIQGPAAVICLDKLVCLFDRLPKGAAIIANIHDGYLLTVDKKTVDYDASVIKEILQEPNDFYPDLNLTVRWQVGDTLPESKNDIDFS
jgi:DNA polymerase family A